MHLPKRKPKPYVEERQRLLEELKKHDPTTESYQTVMARINELDKILNRTTELKKTVIPAVGGIGAVAGIYALQQFAGVIVPKAMETLATRQEHKKHKESENF